jgi:hypothetical protein
VCVSCVSACDAAPALRRPLRTPKPRPPRYGHLNLIPQLCADGGGGWPWGAQIVEVYGRTEAQDVIRAGVSDYMTHYGNLSKSLGLLRMLATSRL